MEDNYKKEWYDKNKGKVADYNKKYYERKVKRLSGEDNTMVEIKGDDVIIRISRMQLKELLMGDVVGKDAGDRKRKDVSGRKESRVRRRERGSRRGSRKDKGGKDKGGKDKSRRGSRKDKSGKDKIGKDKGGKDKGGKDKDVHKRRHSKK
jgi:hypothetical protein